MRPPLSVHANGKILISGEYLVMLGATALAVPLKPGQELHLEETGEPGVLMWEAFDTTGLWFRGTFTLPEPQVISSTDPEIAQRLVKLLQAACKLNESYLSCEKGLKVTTQLEFNRNWGFGSSSTLISLIARWAGIQPLELHRLVSKGSGYDVACSVAESPILYQMQNNMPRIASVDFNPPYVDSMFLVYLGTKQSSDPEVEKFRQHGGNFKQEIKRISHISLLMTSEDSRGGFIDLLTEHEAIMESTLGRKSVKKLLFPDFEGAVKSLGAWGGDFVLAVTGSGPAYVTEYFKSKKLDTILPYTSITFKADKKQITIG
ncbi:MAG: GHMP kinase [Bacteroidales bacterium]|nr:GHMP kinase [Bacteroidales bacterium]